MTSVVIQDSREEICIPAWVVDLDSFHRWSESDDFPEHVRIDYLQGEVWVDMGDEQVFSHNQVKTEYTITLGRFIKIEKRGRYFQDGVRVTHPEVAISSIPDGMFIATKTLRAGRVRLVEGAESGYVRVEGSPDMVLEVVSESSVHKDTVQLQELYWKAGIREYWLVDARRAPLRFQILRHTPKGYVAIRPQAGWIKSGVFGKSFRLQQEQDEFGHPVYTLAMR
jgi:Uma2 family endonuclease